MANNKQIVYINYPHDNTGRLTTLGELKEFFSFEKKEWKEWFFHTLHHKGSAVTSVARYSLTKDEKVNYNVKVN